ncbi:MAG: hypothetical protein OXN89_23850 [Bryobacterales bacterium]|nr:hypothetical protein [Bryobacterales bacterium]
MIPQRHYCIPPLSRVDLDELLELVEDMRYFILHAPRQTGKTSTLLVLADKLNATGEYDCVYMNVEPAQTAREDVGRAMRAILTQMGNRARMMLGDTFVRSAQPGLLTACGPDSVLDEMLTLWSEASEKPLVLLIDEIDTLVGDSLISVLRQLRAGYDQRPRGFPQSIILCGVRDPRDYRIFSSSLGENVTWGSAFNIKAKSLRLGDFTEGEVRSLLGQHTAERGQEFAPGVIDRIWHFTQGQPWLVNALALQACFEDKAGRDRTRPIGLAAIDKAKETLILNRVTHLDQLTNQLGEERVRRVILPMIAGSDDARYTPRDLEYVRDLGLVAAAGPVRMANPIYAEVVPRDLTLTQQSVLESLISPTWYVRKDGSLDLPKLLEAFQGYFRENSDSWLERYGHREAGPHLVLQSYLHRVVNGGGRITREYALARGRSDLLIEWPRPGGTLHSNPSKHVVECKVVGDRSGPERVIGEGLRQTESYMDLCGAESGHLVVFDIRPGRTWKERIFRRGPEPGQAPITVWGM